MRTIVTIVVIAVTACSRAAVPGESADGSGSKSGTVPAADQDSDWKAIESLEAEAKSLAKTAGCASPDGCRTAPVGNRACGGPRYYIPYCSVTTDSAALYKKLAEISKAEQAYNQKNGLASTCEFRMPPAVELSGGMCVAK